MGGLVRTIIIVILILMLIGSLPMWGYASGWGLVSRGWPRDDSDYPDYISVARNFNM